MKINLSLMSAFDEKQYGYQNNAYQNNAYQNNRQSVLKLLVRLGINCNKKVEQLVLMVYKTIFTQNWISVGQTVR